jgi:hypothetical protein
VKGLSWSDERYVRSYTRDTLAWQLLSWQARALYHELKRHCDRVGVVKVGAHGVRGLAKITLLPVEVVQPGLEDPDGLLADAWVEWDPAVGTLLIPDHMEADEAPQSDAARARKYRETQRVTVRVAGATPSHRRVTSRDDDDSSVTANHEPLQTVTICDDLSDSVMGRHGGGDRGSKPSLPPSLPPSEERENAPARAYERTEPISEPPKPDPRASRYQTAKRLVAKQDQARKSIDLSARPSPQTVVDKVQLLLTSHSEQDLEDALDCYIAEAQAMAARGDPTPLRFMNGATNWQPDQILRAIARKPAVKPAVAAEPARQTSAERMALLDLERRAKDRKHAEDVIAAEPPGTQRRRIAEAVLRGDDAEAERLLLEGRPIRGQPVRLDA